MAFSGQAEHAWWRRDETEAATVYLQAWSAFAALRRDTSGREERLAEYRALYHDVGVHRARKHRYSFNVLRSCIDTLGAKIAKARPRPICITDEGSWEQQRKGKLLTQYLDGSFYEAGLYAQTQRAFKDASIYDVGLVKLWIEAQEDEDGEPVDGKIRCERVMPDEVWVDPSEAYYGKPRTIYHHRPVDREALAAMFPEKAAAIAMAEPSEAKRNGQRVARTMVDVLEAWHLESRPGAKDGRHVICTKGMTLLSESYEDPFLPFVDFRISDNESMGFYGDGLAEQLRGIQREINSQLDNIRVAHKRLGRPFVFIKPGAKISKGDLNNEIGAIIEGEEPPQFGVSQAMGAEVYNWVRELVQRAYQITGISETSARSAKPAGVTSGVAIRAVDDIETERFVLIGQQWEEFHMEIARRWVHLARKLYADGVDLPVRGSSGKFLRTIKWSDVDMKDDAFVLKVYPMGLLPTRPEGRMERAMELLQAQMIDKTTALSLIGAPDIEDATSLATAALDDVRMVVDHMLDGGDYIPPEPFMDLKLAAQVAQSSYLRAKTRGADETALEKLRGFMADIQELVKAGAPAPAPAPAPMPGGMPGGPAGGINPQALVGAPAGMGAA